MSILDVANRWVEQGIAVLPIAHRSKLPAIDALRITGDVDEFDQASWGRYQSELPDRETLRCWFSGPRRNLAIVTGWRGLVVIDFDLMEAYEAWRQWAEDRSLSTLSTYKVLTGRGVHLYVSVDQPVRTAHIGLIDIKAAGGYVLAPPSVHPSGRVYREVDPGASIMHVRDLSEILPFEIEPEVPVVVEHIAPRSPATLSDDVWNTADNPRQMGGGGAVETIRTRILIEDLLPEAGRARGRWIHVRCPFHDDKTPSFWIDRQQQLCGCMAGCTVRPLDVIGLYARLNGMANGEAIRDLAQRAIG